MFLSHIISFHTRKEDGLVWWTAIWKNWHNHARAFPNDQAHFRWLWNRMCAPLMGCPSALLAPASLAFREIPGLSNPAGRQQLGRQFSAGCGQVTPQMVLLICSHTSHRKLQDELQNVECAQSSLFCLWTQEKGRMIDHNTAGQFVGLPCIWVHRRRATPGWLCNQESDENTTQWSWGTGAGHSSRVNAGLSGMYVVMQVRIPSTFLDSTRASQQQRLLCYSKKTPITLPALPAWDGLLGIICSYRHRI